MVQATWEMALIVIIVLASVAVAMLLLWVITAVGRVIMRTLMGEFDEKEVKRHEPEDHHELHGHAGQ